MSEQEKNPGNATGNGDGNYAPGQGGTGGTPTQQPGDGAEKPEKSVPYTRFQQVNEARKSAEATLQTVVDELLEDVPEDMREIVPNLPAAEKIKWIRAAFKKGVFGGGGQPSGPDSQRPGGKPPKNFDGLSPTQIMAMGYKK